MNYEYEDIKKEILGLANPVKAKILQKFFKTDKGQYGEGDIFLGITVPILRKIAKKYENLSLNDLENLINSDIHEERLVSLLILIGKYMKSSEKEQKKYVGFYLKNIEKVNNWDLVDLSASHILGNFLSNNTDRKILYTLVRSKNLWKKRISIVATLPLIRNNDFWDTIKLSEILLNDKQDLIQKAVGWMLREIGKRNMRLEYDFIKDHYKNISRTTLRYSIEKFPEEMRLNLLVGKI